jgi:hypothetical protein
MAVVFSSLGGSTLSLKADGGRLESLSFFSLFCLFIFAIFIFQKQLKSPENRYLLFKTLYVNLSSQVVSNNAFSSNCAAKRFKNVCAFLFVHRPCGITDGR